MDRVNGLNWTDIGGGRRGFRGRDAANGLAGTELTAAWLNATQEELAFLAGLSGAALDPLKWTQVAEGIRCGKLNYLAAGGTGAAYVAPMTPAPAAYARLHGGTFQLVPPVDNVGPVTLSVGDLGALPIQRQDGLPLKAGDLLAGRPVLVALLPSLGAWQVIGWLPSFSKRRLEANLDLYVNSATGNDNNPGTSALPLRTLQAAANYLLQRVDLNGYGVRIFGAGSFSAGVAMDGSVVGQTLPQAVSFELGTSAVTVGAGSCFWGGYSAAFEVVGGKLSAGGTAAGQGCAISCNGGQILYRGNEFSTCSVAHVSVAYGGVAGCQGAAIKISGGAPAHLLSTGELIDSIGASYTLIGSPAFTNAFAVANGGSITARSATFSGAATGQRFSVDVWGSIYVAGAGANFFPGNAAGYLTPQGDYR